MATRFSICILTFNRLEAVQRCFDSLQSTLERDDVSCWVLDNASTDGTAEYLATLDGILLIVSAENHGVAGGRARLLDLRIREISTIERVIFLDSDAVIIDNDWLDVLDAALSPENVGLVGPGGSFVNDDFSGFVAGKPGDVDCVAGYCQMFKSALLQYGLHIDETYHGFWAEDSQFCLDIRALGWDVLCVPVGVMHNPSHSGYGQDMALHDQHIELFRSKWQGKGLTRSEGAF